MLMILRESHGGWQKVGNETAWSKYSFLLAV